LARPAAITAVDQEQPRLNQPAPLPRGGAVLEQSFRAGHNGLSSVDLLAVVYPGEGPTATLTLRVLDSAGRLIAARVLSGVAHNAPVDLSFAPQPASAGQLYVLQLAGTPDNQTTVWAYSLDGYPDGELRLSGKVIPGDLRFSTSYTYLPLDALRDSLAAGGRVAQVALPLWAILFAPGLVALDILADGPNPPGPPFPAQCAGIFDLKGRGEKSRLRWGFARTTEGRAEKSRERWGFAHTTVEYLGKLQYWPTAWTRWGVALGLSLSLLACAWLWIGVLGLRWSPISLGILYAAASLVVVVRFVWRCWTVLRTRGAWQWPRRESRRGTAASLQWHNGLLGLILLVSLGAHFLAVRDLAFPPWVDSSHHFAIARLLAETGQVPASYAPILPIPRFQYHFGFHALAVTLAWLANQGLIDVFLWLGPVLQGLVPLALYTAVIGMTGRRRAALIAAFFGGLVSFFPGYYATWGRFTQLTALLVLGPAMAVSWRAGQRAGGWPVRRWAQAALIGLLAAGLLLTHYPVFLMWVVFVGLVGLFHLRRAWLLLAGGALVGSLAALPWLWRLGHTVALLYSRSPQPLAAPAGYNAFPWEYFGSPLERGWMIAAAVALAWGLLQGKRVIWLTAAWLAALFALVNVGSGNWLVNNNTLAISLFVPGAIALGWGADRWLACARVWLRPTQRFRAPARTLRMGLGVTMLMGLSGAAGYAGARGVQTQIAVINPATILATAADRQALDWLAQKLPADAVVLINGWDWLNGTWAGSDGGAWIWPLTGRRTTLPPVDYAYSDLASQRPVNDFNAQISQATDANTPVFRALLQSAGVTHIYIGAHGGSLKPEMFSGSPYYRLLYSNGAAWIFAVGGGT
jgi:hypothetical protein